jgi:hypothetical protein
MCTINLVTGITVKIVGIEANSNGQSHYHYDVSGTSVEDNVCSEAHKGANSQQS